MLLLLLWQGQEWKEKKARTRKQKSSKAEPDVDISDSTKVEELLKEPEAGDYQAERYDRGGSVPRGRRNDRAPPRFQKGALCCVHFRSPVSAVKCGIVRNFALLQLRQVEAEMRTNEEMPSQGTAVEVGVEVHEVEGEAVDRRDPGKTHWLLNVQQF